MVLADLTKLLNPLAGDRVRVHENLLSNNLAASMMLPLTIVVLGGFGRIIQGSVPMYPVGMLVPLIRSDPTGHPFVVASIVTIVGLPGSLDTDGHHKIPPSTK